MCDQLVELARKVSIDHFNGQIVVKVVPYGSSEEVMLRRIFSLKVKGFVLAEVVGGEVVRFKYLKGIWHYFREPHKEEQYLIREFSSFMASNLS